jgi:hypothetical protein
MENIYAISVGRKANNWLLLLLGMLSVAVIIIAISLNEGGMRASEWLILLAAVFNLINFILIFKGMNRLKVRINNGLLEIKWYEGLLYKKFGIAEVTRLVISRNLFAVYSGEALLYKKTIRSMTFDDRREVVNFLKAHLGDKVEATF